MRRAAFFLLTIMALSACKPGIPRGVLSRGKMEDVLFDYHIAQAMADQGDSAEVRRYAYVLSVFRKHGITEAEFDSSMLWYCAHSYELRDIYARLGERMEAEAYMAEHSVDVQRGLGADGDTVSLWRWQRFYHLQPTRSSRLLHVTSPADSSCRKGDEYIWRFQANFIQRSGMRQATAIMALRMEGDTLLTTTSTMRSDGQVELRLMRSDTLTLKQVDCYIYMPDAADAQLPSLLITEPLLVRLRRK